MSTELPFEVRCDRRPDSVVVVVRGELDLSTVEALRAVLQGPEASSNVVVLDLRSLDFIDSSGLSLLVSEQHRAQKAGRRFAIAVGGAPAVSRLFELTGLTGTLDLIEDPDGVEVT